MTKQATGWVAAGWSIDPDSNESIPVDVYVDGKLVIRTTADAGRGWLEIRSGRSLQDESRVSPLSQFPYRRVWSAKQKRGLDARRIYDAFR